MGKSRPASRQTVLPMKALRPPLLRLTLDGLVVDNFAGGGGASEGVEMALGRGPDIAVNHDPEALAMHAANHPRTRHLCENVFKVDPRRVCAGRPVALAWFSPDCTYHSKARGGKPFRDRNKARRRRGLAWVAIKWAKAVRPRVIIIENVEEFERWGPLDVHGQPDPKRRGESFKKWRAQLENTGYVVELRQLTACDYGAPTSRKRLFIIARCDGQPIVWPEPTHGPGRAHPHRTAAECIDWSIPCPSIFLTKADLKKLGRQGQKLGIKRPLAAKTLRRIARGIQRFVLGAAQPFVIPVTHAGDHRIHSLDEPLRTITAAQRGELALVAPTLIQTGYGERKGQAPRSLDLHKPLGTIVGGGAKHALVAAFLAKHNGGHEATGSKLGAPIATITTKDHHALVTSHLVKFRGTCQDGQPVTEPLPTITAGGWHLGEVRAFLIKYYSAAVGQEQRLDEPMHTITTKARLGLVTVTIAGEEYAIVDIGMRMLTPRELARGQGFSDHYLLEVPVGNKLTKSGKLTKTAQIRMIGNSVPPDVVAALVAANLDRREQRQARAA